MSAGVWLPTPGERVARRDNPELTGFVVARTAGTVLAWFKDDPGLVEVRMGDLQPGDGRIAPTGDEATR